VTRDFALLSNSKVKVMQAVAYVKSFACYKEKRQRQKERCLVVVAKRSSFRSSYPFQVFNGARYSALNFALPTLIG
jgi:hypothetical protein